MAAWLFSGLTAEVVMSAVRSEYYFRVTCVSGTKDCKDHSGAVYMDSQLTLLAIIYDSKWVLDFEEFQWVACIIVQRTAQSIHSV